MTHSTYLQAALQAPEGGTIRLTYDPGGTPQTSDLVVTAGTIWNSQQAFLTAWMAQVVSDISAGFSGTLVADVANHRAFANLTTPGLNYSVAWSHAGDCTAIRDWLGETGDISNRASAANFSSYAPGTYYSRWPAPEVLRERTGRERAHRMFLDGSQETQHASALDDVADIQMSIELRFGTDPSESLSYVGYTQLGAFIDEVLDNDAGGIGRFTLHHLEAADDAPDTWVFRFPEGELRVQPERVQGAPPDRMWMVRLRAVAMEVPW